MKEKFEDIKHVRRSRKTKKLLVITNNKWSKEKRKIRSIFSFLLKWKIFGNNTRGSVIIYLGFERTWWRLFQNRVVRTKFDIYVFITTILRNLYCYILPPFFNHGNCLFYSFFLTFLFIFFADFFNLSP